LDEPTNHLDIHSVELLIEALNKYEGSLILVSHDRYFVSKVANTIWEIENQKIKIFNGGYEELSEWKERQKQNAEARNQKSEVGSRKSEIRNQKSDADGNRAGSQNPETLQTSDVRPQTS